MMNLKTRRPLSILFVTVLLACGTEEESPPPADGTGGPDAALDANDSIPRDTSDGDIDEDGATPTDATEVGDGSATELADANGSLADTERTDSADGDTPDGIPNACVDDVDVSPGDSPCECEGRTLLFRWTEPRGDTDFVECQQEYSCLCTDNGVCRWDQQRKDCTPDPSGDWTELDSWSGEHDEDPDDALDGSGTADDGSGETAGSGDPDVVSDGSSEGSGAERTP